MANKKNGEVRTGWVSPNGYRYFRVEGKRVPEHRIVVEKAIGKPLRRTADIHHVNGIRDDNRPENLVVCNNRKYHHLLHIRGAALDATGNADKRKCCFCGEYDTKENMKRMWGQDESFFHTPCASARRSELRRAS